MTDIDPETQRQIDSWTKPQPKKGVEAGRPVKGEQRPVKRIGRPPSQRAAQLELQEYMYNHPDKKKAVKVLYEGALDSEHKNQAAFMKILMDRILPTSNFEKMPGRNAIEININRLEPDKPEVIEGETIEQT